MKKDGKPVTPLWSVDKTAVGSSVTIYIDGRFVPVGDPSYTETADGMDAPAYKLLADHTYDKDGNYVGKEGGDYVYVYAAKYVLDGDELKWDHSGISYNYNGGVKRTSVTIKHGEGTSAMTGTIQMPVNIVDGKIDELHFVNAGDVSAPDYSAYFGEGNTTGADYFASHYIDGQLVFDPFGGGIEIDALIQVPGEGGVMVDGTEYVYFPAKVGFKTVGDYIVDGVSVTWSNLAGIRDTYRGGYYNVRLTVAAQGEYTSEGETSYAVAAQGFTAEEFVKVESRVAKEGSLKSATEDAGLPNEGLVGHDRVGEQYNIDPYTFDIGSFREEVEKITSVSVTIDGDTYFFGTKGKGGPAADSADPQDPGLEGYKLTWSFTSMTVNYLGGKVALIAQLTGPDGSVQNYEITYLVQRKLATTLKGTKGGAGNVTGYTVGYDLNNSAEFGVARPDGGGSYEIDPYNPFTRTLPTGWEIGVKVQNAEINKDDGNVTFTDSGSETLTESYLTATMPSNANLTIKKIQEGGAAGEASLQITGGQRIRIPVSIKPVNISGQSAPDNLHTGRVLNGSTTIGGYKVLIAWHGTVTVTYNVNQTAKYDVTFVNPTGGTVTAPAIPGRTVTYNLTPYIGAIVDTAGRVVMDGDVPAHQLVGKATGEI